MPIALKRLKLRNSKLAHVFHGQSGHDLLKFMEKRTRPGSDNPRNFWALNACNFKTVKAMDFKFDEHVSSLFY